MHSAPLGRRLLAGLADFALLAATAGPLNWGMLVLAHAAPTLERRWSLVTLFQLLEVSPGDVLRRGAPFIAMSCLYFGLFWTLTGRTPASRWLGIRVVDIHGLPPKPGWTALRLLAHFLGGLPIALGWIWAMFDLERRAWHDHVSRTYVVRDT